MQQPIRYYITKSGEEPTVRSVKVALGDADARERVPDGAARSDDLPNAARQTPRPVGRASVRQLVKRAVHRRTRKA